MHISIFDKIYNIFAVAWLKSSSVLVWEKLIDWLIEWRFYIPPDTEMFFPANLLAKYWKTKTNTTERTCIRNKIYYNIKWIKKQSQVWSPTTTSGLKTDRAHSGFDTSSICHLLTYLDTHTLTVLTASGPTWGNHNVDNGVHSLLSSEDTRRQTVRHMW